MNRDYPLVSFFSPVVRRRRRDRSRPRGGIPQEKINAREQIARSLLPQVESLSSQLGTMSDEERSAVILKLQHEKKIPLGGLELKEIASSENLTLAIPQNDNLSSLENKISEFGSSNLNSKGYPKNQEIAYLESIQQAEPMDRLSQELYEKYNLLLDSEWVICEIEILTLLPGSNQRRDALMKVRKEIEEFLGPARLHGNLFEHEESKGLCRAVIRCTGEKFKLLVEEERWQRKIIWFDARPQFETVNTVFQDFDITKLGQFSSPPAEAPIVCVIDSGVTPGNPFLEPVVREDLIFSFLKSSPDRPEDENGHGSGVASLVAYYALDPSPGAENEGHAWIASARILTSNNELEALSDSPDVELRLLSSILREVVERFAPLGVKIFNFSFGITNQKWNIASRRTVPRQSWLARTIDRLCREHDIVFLISTGNISPIDVRGFIENGAQYPGYLLSEEASLLDPSQSSLALTVGSIAPNTLATGNVATSIALSETNCPSPFTRGGPGINRETKPDLVDYGGNYLVDEGGQVRTNLGTNVIMASHQLTPAISHDSGTSFATPRVAYKVSRIFSDLQSLGIEPSASLLKAFVVNSSSHAALGKEVEEFKQEDGISQNKAWLNLLGHGIPDHNRATSCEKSSAVLWHQGEIRPGHVMFLNIPVPACLSEVKSSKKRLTITVVYAPKVQKWGLETYLGTTLKWRVFRGDVSHDEIFNSRSRDEEEENIPVDSPGELSTSIGITKRSRGTVQHDIIEWTQHKESYSQDFYTLAIESYEKWNKLEPDPIGIVVRIEDTSGSVPVYVEVQNQLRAEIQKRVEL